METLPARVPRKWLVSQNGETALAAPEPARRPLSVGQRHQAYRLGLQLVDQFMRARGFTTNCEPSTHKLSYDKNGVYIDIALCDTATVATVTSYPGYEYREPDRKTPGQQRTNARVTVLKTEGVSQAVRVIVCASLAGGSSNPVYVPLPDADDDPVRLVVKSTLFTLACACAKLPAVQEAFNSAAAVAAQADILDHCDSTSIPFQ